MAKIRDWHQHAVVQKRPRTGCIPWGYEILLRIAGVPDIDFDSFQDDFDLERDPSSSHQRRNDFGTVADAVRDRYPHVRFRRRTFPTGAGSEKLRFVEEKITQQQPVLISLAMQPLGSSGWHIMPVVDARDDSLVLLHSVDPDDGPQTFAIRKSELVRIHDEYSGGHDVAYLEEART